MKNTTLTKNGIHHIYHVAPLHYLIFYMRYKQLFSKSILIENGFINSHFRSTTRRVDTLRGFGDFIHCSGNPFPPLLKSMIKKGYPHMVINLNTDILDEDSFYICKYNIGRNRGVYTESLTTGKCYGDFKLPVATTEEEKNYMLSSIAPDQYLEILIKNSISIPDAAIFSFLNKEDAEIAYHYFKKMNIYWGIQIINQPLDYRVIAKRKESVLNFLENSFKDQKWKGDGLEFDR